MKTGDIMMIWYDPITKKDPEGNARLLEKVSARGSNPEHWKVMFLDGNELRKQVRSIWRDKK